MIFKKNISITKTWEYIFPLLATASLFISCTIVSPKKFFWNDELLSYYLLSDQSFTHMIVAWGDKFNNAPPLYFILGWLWAKVFTSADLSLRLFSSLGICVSCLTVWITLRHTYNFWSASIGTFSVFCLSDLISYHNSEVRMYGLFPAVCALGLHQFSIINRKQKSSWKTLGTNVCLHAAIVLTHLYGILYSGAILFAFIICDRYFKNLWRPKVYLSIILGWIFLIPCITPIINQADIAKPRIWFHIVGIIEFLDYFSLSTKFSLLILVLLAISALLYVTDTNNDNQESEVFSNKSQSFSEETSLLILAVSFLIVPVLAWLITRTIKPILVDRYIIPTIAISWPILLAYLSSRIFSNSTLSKRSDKKSSSNNLLVYKQRILLLMLIVILIIYPIFRAKNTVYSPRPGINDDKYGYTELPIAVEAGHDFLPRSYYSPQSNKYFDILDWETALNNTSSMFATGDYKALDALKRNYPQLNIIQSQEFINKYDRFLVLNEIDQKWFEKRIENNPKYQVKLLGTTEGAFGPLHVFLVESKK